MAEIEYELADLIKFSSQQKPIEFGTAFNSLIASRIETAIDDKKIEVAKRMFNPAIDDEVEEIEADQEEE